MVIVSQKDGTIIVADEGIVVASNDESLLGRIQPTTRLFRQ